VLLSTASTSRTVSIDETCAAFTAGIAPRPTPTVSLENSRRLLAGSHAGRGDQQGKGIGRSIALLLAEAGADVIVSARAQSDFTAVATEITALGRCGWASGHRRSIINISLVLLVELGQGRRFRSGRESVDSDVLF
jgi:hypothetical protein